MTPTNPGPDRIISRVHPGVHHEECPECGGEVVYQETIQICDDCGWTNK